jgi:hypothetical protein
VLKPHNSILWHETVIGWLDQWLEWSQKKSVLTYINTDHQRGREERR